MSDFRWQLPKLQYDAPHKCESMEFNNITYTQDICDVDGDVYAFMVQGKNVHSVFVTRSRVVTGVIRKRPFLICDIHVPTKRLVYRQPFYRSSGTATPELSPKGTWWPFDCLWTEEMIAAVKTNDDGLDLPVGWIGKYQWTPAYGGWTPHNKRYDALNIITRQIVEWLTSTIEED